MTILFISNDPTNPTSLHDLGAQHYITDTFTNIETNEDGELLNNVTFPLPLDPYVDPANTEQ
jgi:hypothetical protein